MHLPVSPRANLIGKGIPMSYEIKSSPSLDYRLADHPAQPSHLRDSSRLSHPDPSSVLHNTYLPIYSQCGDLFSSVKFLSRSLKRMLVDHAITGYSAQVMESDRLMCGIGSDIDLIMSDESYEHFLRSCVHQRMKPIEGEQRMFWDSRTGCTVRIYVTGERIKVGRRSVKIPALGVMLPNDEGIKTWTLDIPVVRKATRKRTATVVNSLPSPVLSTEATPIAA